MNILALDTSSTACSVALLHEGELSERHEILENRHSKFLLAFINELLNQAHLKIKNLDAVAVGNGPGSFTGIRLGLGVAQGLAFGIHKPLIPVSSLHAIAISSSAKNILVAVDARMGEVYWQCFQITESQELAALKSARLDRPENIVLDKPGLNWQGLGSGFDQYSDQLSVYLSEPGNWIQNVHPQASSIIKLARTEIKKTGMPTDKAILPEYIRDKVTR